MPKSSPLKVLIIDDEPDLREIMQFDFDQAGHETLLAENGKVALEILKKNHVDAIVSDVLMPEMDGVQLLKEIRAQNNNIVMIFVTAHSAYKENVIFDLGGNGFVRKPFRRRQLVENCERLLLDEKTRWSQPVKQKLAGEVKLQWSDMKEALEKNRLQFGNGGFSVNKGISNLYEEEAVLQFSLKIGSEEVLGFGAVRWNSSEAGTGVEFLFLTSESFKIWEKIMGANPTTKFLPNPV